MKKILNEIQSGKFVEEFMLENKTGKKHFEALRQQGRQHPIEAVGTKLRQMMPWIGKNKLVDTNKN